MSQTLPEKLTSDILIKLTNTHIHRYSSIINSNSPNVRVAECQELLDIWRRIQIMGGSLHASTYTTREKAEIADAYFDEYGDYEEYSYPPDEEYDED